MRVPLARAARSGSIKRRRRGVRSAAVLAVLSGVATAGVVSVPSSSLASTTSGRVKTVTADRKFFVGKTLTYIVTNSVGSAPDAVAQAQLQGIETYLKAKVNLQYIPGGGSVQGQNTIASSAADGLTFGIFQTLDDVDAIYKRADLLSFSLQKQSFISATFTPPGIVVGCANSQYKTWDQLVHATSPVRVVVIATGAAIVLDKALMAAYSVPHAIVTGYSGVPAMTAGCARGDGDFSYGAPTQWSDATGSHVAPFYNPILQMGTQPKGSAFAYLNATTETLAQYLKAHPPKTRLGRETMSVLQAQYAATSPKYLIFGPQGISKGRLLALQDAFKYANDLPATKAAFLAAGIPPGEYPVKNVAAWMKTQLKYQNIFANIVSAP